MEKKTYYKVVCEDFPQGVLHEMKEDALCFSKECRERDEKAYIRAVKMTKEEFEATPEID